ncbi:hypothetical protein SAMN04489751_3681 [Brevibacterium sandarakinum]|uniref:Uncharacterized protein n=1 Tax=Brevibacterium sandarakinum TaxID=629680 RepID=A0A1H1XDB3_BRESA|nr:hypothetical protein SAMN04489751_3681 [Brevibacterium sandarakinum]
MVTHGVTRDVPTETLPTVTEWLRAHRRVHDKRPWQRAMVFVQAVMVPRWFGDATAPARLLCVSAGLGRSQAVPAGKSEL